jgi:hypothetical protein
MSLSSWYFVHVLNGGGNGYNTRDLGYQNSKRIQVREDGDTLAIDYFEKHGMS